MEHVGLLRLHRVSSRDIWSWQVVCSLFSAGDLPIHWQRLSGLLPGGCEFELAGAAVFEKNSYRITLGLAFFNSKI